MGLFESEPLSSSTLRDEPDWALVERITGKKCPETVNLRTLSRMTQSELRESLGLSDLQGKKLGAALVLGERLANEEIERGMSIKSGEDVYRIFRGQMKDAKKEGFYAVTVDQKHQVIDIHQISEGTLSMCPVHPREAFNPIIRDSAAAVIFIHNHPSGNPEPSPDDYNLTVRLAESGKLLGIRVLDHVVIGDGAFVSFQERDFDFERGSGLSQAAEAYGGREDLHAREELPEEKSTTAILRIRASDAERNLDWKKAAEYYRMAIEKYPSQPANSALAKHDIELLTGSMKECLRMETTEKDLSHFSPQARSGAKEAPNGKTRTFLIAPREKKEGGPAPDYTGLVVIEKTPHKIDIWKDGRIQIARADPDRYTSVGSGRLVAGGPGSLAGPVQIQTSANIRTSVDLGIQGIGKGTQIHLSVSEKQQEKILQKTQKKERGIER